MGVSLPHHMSREWIFRGVVVSSTLLLITSIIMIGLKSVPNEIWRSDRSKGGLRIEYAEGSLEVPSVPPRVFELLDPTAVGSAVACLIISLFGIIITFYSAKKGPVKVGQMSIYASRRCSLPANRLSSGFELSSEQP